jgi:hypothetical protein
MSSRTIPFLVFFLALVLVSCTSLRQWAFGPDEPETDKPAASGKDKPAGPQVGDTKVVGGVEFVYAKNTRYMADPYQPEYLWVKKSEYMQTPMDAFKERVAAERKENAALKKRLATLEAEFNKDKPAPAAGRAAAQAPADRGGREAGERTWEAFGSNPTGISYYIDRGSITYPSAGSMQLWRKRTFPEKAFQKEIISREEVDCRRKRYRTLEVQGVYWDGRHEESKAVSPWVRFYEDTTEDLFFVDVCGEVK